MTSKISFIKLIVQDIRHRGWTAALSAIALFLMMPVYTMLYLSTFSGSMKPGFSDYDHLVRSFPGLLNGHSIQTLTVIIAALAVLMALSGFGYLHSKEKLDFYHSLPVKRTRWFASAYLSGLILFMIPYTVCAALIVSAGASKGIMTANLAVQCMQSAFGGILSYIVIYTACVFASMLTGRTAIGLLLSLVVIVWPFIVLNLFSSLQLTFFKSYYDEAVPLSQQLADYLTPLGIFSALITQSGIGELSFGVSAAAVFTSALLFTAALLLNRIYPSEAAGNTVAFPAISPILKVLICIPAALFSGLMIQGLMGISDVNWICFISLLASVILCIFIDFIYHMDLKLLRKGWKSTLFSIGGVTVILCIFRFDLPGYDTWIPDIDRLKGMSFCPDSFTVYFSYPDSDPDSRLGYYVPEEDMELLYTLAQTGINHLENGITADDFYSYTEDIPDNCLPAVFRYRLSSGRTVLREYAVDYDKAEKVVKKLLESDEYRKQLFPVFHMEGKQISSISLSDIYGRYEELLLGKEQRIALLDAYEKDVMEVSADTLISGKPIGDLCVEIRYAGADSSSGVYSADISQASYEEAALVSTLYIYPEYGNTLELLEEFGFPLHREIDSSDVRSVTLTLSQETTDSGKYTEMLSALSGTAETSESGDITYITVTGEEDIDLVLDHTGGYAGGILDMNFNYMDYIDIQYKDGNFFSYSI